MIHHFADSRINVESWTFVPIYTGSIDQSPEIEGFFAYADPATLTGQNLSAVLFERDQDNWNTSSWYTSNVKEALESVILTLNIDNTLWEDIGASPFIGVPENPKPITNGIIEADPFEPVIENASDPASIVTALMSVGYAATNTPGVLDQGCNLTDFSEGLRSMAAEYLSQGDSTVVDVPIDDLCGRVRPRGDHPVRPPKPTTAPAWTDIPTDGPLPGTGWIPGGWPTTGTPPVPDWYCFATAGGSSCFCSREQELGRWETKPNWWGGTSIRWHTVIERESCNSVGGGPCPAGGPPRAGSGCTTTYH